MKIYCFSRFLLCYYDQDEIDDDDDDGDWGENGVYGVGICTQKFMCNARIWGGILEASVN